MGWIGSWEEENMEEEEEGEGALAEVKEGKEEVEDDFFIIPPSHSIFMPNARPCPRTSSEGQPNEEEEEEEEEEEGNPPHPPA